MEEFLASDDPRVPTSVFANGNNTNAYYADTQGRELRARMDTARGAARPVRYVIWSWSADKVLKRYLDDARAKLPRIEFESYLLADYASRISREVPLCLVGYSFGARLVGGTLHLLGGGELAGRRLPSEALTRRVELRAALVAGALDCHWFAQGMKLDAAMAAVDRLLVTTNPRDIVLDFYPILYQQEGPEAMGYTGPSTRGLPDEWVHKVELLDVMPWVEKKHRLRHYLDCPPVMASLGRFILFR